MAVDLQAKFEIVEDTIGAYVAKLSALLKAGGTLDAGGGAAIPGLVNAFFLRNELTSAAADRAYLTQVRNHEAQLSALEMLYDGKLTAMRKLQERGMQPALFPQSFEEFVRATVR